MSAVDPFTNPAAVARITAHAQAAIDRDVMRDALRDILLGAQLMGSVGDPKSAFNRYCAEVARVAGRALDQVRS